MSDKVMDGRHLMNLDEHYALLAWLQSNIETLKAMAPRAPYLVSESPEPGSPADTMRKHIAEFGR
jgi:hypothetical protein